LPVWIADILGQTLRADDHQIVSIQFLSFSTVTIPMSEANKVHALAAGPLQSLIDEGGPVLVDIWASWCGPCRGMLPIVEEVAGERTDGLRVAKIEISNPETPENDDWVGEFGVRSVPTFILFKGGTDIAGFAGTATKGELNDWLDTQLAG
jgi:thioredoxin 1